MYQIDKVQIPADSKFNLECAMELANLIAVAYSDYEVWDKSAKTEKDLPPAIITASKEFVDLRVNQIEQIEEVEAPNVYSRLDPFWNRTERVEEYKRIKSFWFPQWWWGEALNLKNLWEFLKTDIRDIFQNLQDLVVDEQLFGFIAQSQTQPNKFFVVFRGTREAAEWFNNFRPVPKPFLEEEGFRNLGGVRNGFNLIYSSKKGRESKNPTIKETIAKLFKEQRIDSNSEIFVTGHSLGAGLATLATLHLHKVAELNNVQPLIQLYTFASPRVGDETFAEYFNKIQSFRIINSEDMIQSVPFSTTQVVDDETFDGMKPQQKVRFRSFRAFLEGVTGGQAGKHYQHVGVPITFTKQTGTIAGNHNLTKTYREALNIKR
ncbi:lipase family protein [Microcoleus sp. FACHB-SPT15]|uniref:lipase family protein n=1 Tax=Microcoleus sp. FACHB-SPT15 TaxID=2692830 RepID=UPI0017876CBE|nr:lipase family protein [Microcoleus sp. FACHB-SPT15]MBD1807483.1 lipase family protein [Microcoleus sp. FACHB-SPT15]